MRRGEEGYTLLELLVALVVFGFIMAGLAQSYRFGLSVWSTGTRNITVPQNMAAADAALTRIIAAAQPGSMAGSGAQLALTTRLPPGAGLPGLADAVILLTRDGTLVLRYRAHPAGIPLTAPPSLATEPLIQGVQKFSIAYLVPAPNTAPGWAASWSGKALPLLVRLHIQLADGRPWPDLIATPAAQAPAPAAQLAGS